MIYDVVSWRKFFVFLGNTVIIKWNIEIKKIDRMIIF